MIGLGVEKKYWSKEEREKRETNDAKPDATQAGEEAMTHIDDENDLDNESGDSRPKPKPTPTPTPTPGG